MKATLLAAASALRALVTAARTGETVDPATLRPVLDQLGSTCPE